MVYLSSIPQGEERGWGISYLTTSILPLRKFMPHYGTFVKIKGVGAIRYLTIFFLFLCGIMPHYGIFVMIGGGGYKLLDHLYSALSRNYAPLWYVCYDWG